MLTQERKRLPYKQWLKLVEETKELILTSPKDFFRDEVPGPLIFSAAIKQVFEGFLEDQRIRLVQAPVHLKPSNESRRGRDINSA
jgi:hypothetical protein